MRYIGMPFRFAVALVVLAMFTATFTFEFIYYAIFWPRSLLCLRVWKDYPAGLWFWVLNGNLAKARTRYEAPKPRSRYEDESGGRP